MLLLAQRSTQPTVHDDARAWSDQARRGFTGHDRAQDTMTGVSRRLLERLRRSQQKRALDAQRAQELLEQERKRVEELTRRGRRQRETHGADGPIISDARWRSVTSQITQASRRRPARSPGGPRNPVRGPKSGPGSAAPVRCLIGSGCRGDAKGRRFPGALLVRALPRQPQPKTRRVLHGWVLARCASALRPANPNPHRAQPCEHQIAPGRPR